MAIVENAFEEIAVVKATPPEKIEEEVKLLEIAKQLIGQIPFKEIDLLIVDEIGKNTSGVGMDTNVTGRFWIPGECEPRAPKIKRIVVLDLTDETHGNAIGIRLADLTTKRVVEKIDYNSTFVKFFDCRMARSRENAHVLTYRPRCDSHSNQRMWSNKPTGSKDCKNKEHIAVGPHVDLDESH